MGACGLWGLRGLRGFEKKQSKTWGMGWVAVLIPAFSNYGEGDQCLRRGADAFEV